ncbi:MAG: peptide chain release factor N(5)-glutamine methyltransferase [Ndongobacter sp.]|nr:peptide chain release factor N(5)-glutamine methyltransferase [Ndongobacter sp.]
MVIGELLRTWPDEQAVVALSYLLNESPGSVRARQHRMLPEKVAEEFHRIHRLRETGYPLQYAIGRWNFYGRDFLTDPRALIPRPETELLVEKMVRDGVDGCLIADVGTGSGILPLTLVRETRCRLVIGLDLSAEALSLARENEAYLNRTGEPVAAARIAWRQSDLLETLEGAADVICSNPPYIPETERGKLQRELDYEPEMALYAGADGMAVYRRLIIQAADKLTKNGRLYLEIGDGQGAPIRAEMERAGFVDVVLQRDFSDRERIVSGRLGKHTGENTCLRI